MARTLTITAATIGSLTAALLGGWTSLAAGTETDPPPSQVVLRDGPGDVWTGTDNQDVSRWVEAGPRPAFDVTRMRVVHGSDTVAARMRFADLRRRGELIYIVKVRTPELTARALVYSGEGFGAGQHMLVEDNEEWAEIPCRGMVHRVDFARDVVDVRIPSQCVDDPSWVQVQALDFAWVEGRRVMGYTDNPHNHRATVTGFTPRLYPPSPAPVAGG